jgi:hypothetical protein
MNASIAAIVIGVAVAVALALGSAFYLDRTERTAVQAGGPANGGKDASRIESPQNGDVARDPSTSGSATDGAASPESR